MNDFASDYVNNNLIKNKMNNLKSIVLFFLLGLCQSYGDWKQTTAVVSQQKDETLVKRIYADQILFKHSDPQLCVEWSMVNNVNTIVLGGIF